jgi:hypothetical protein
MRNLSLWLESWVSWEGKLWEGLQEGKSSLPGSGHAHSKVDGAKLNPLVSVLPFPILHPLPLLS